MAVANLVPPVEKEYGTAVPEYPIFRLSVEQYHAMIQSGVLTEDDPIELLEGWLVTKMPQDAPHLFSSQVLQDILREVLPPGWFVNIQGPVTTADSEPEPDAAVIRGNRRDYLQQKPGPQETALVVEVADSTLRQDRSLKKRLYAAAGIPVYWIVNLVDNQLEVFSQPSGPAARPDYEEQQILGPEEKVAVVIDGRTLAHIPVKELLP